MSLQQLSSDNERLRRENKDLKSENKELKTKMKHEFKRGKEENIALVQEMEVKVYTLELKLLKGSTGDLIPNNRLPKVVQPKMSTQI